MNSPALSFQVLHCDIIAYTDSQQEVWLSKHPCQTWEGGKRLWYLQRSNISHIPHAKAVFEQQLKEAEIGDMSLEDT